MIKPTLWKRFVTWLVSIVTLLSTKEPNIVNNIVNQETPAQYDAEKYTKSFKSLYTHKSFTPKPKKPERPKPQKIDYSKTRYVFDRPPFIERVSRRFGRG
jgi:hypothetical protein